MNTVRHLGALLGRPLEEQDAKSPPERTPRATERGVRSGVINGQRQLEGHDYTNELTRNLHFVSRSRLALSLSLTLRNQLVKRWLCDISARSADGLAPRSAWPDLDRDRWRSKHRTEIQRASFAESDGGRSSAAVPQELGDSPIVNAIWVSRPSNSSALTHELEWGAPLTITDCT
jgi:hypothetical protein